MLAVATPSPLAPVLAILQGLADQAKAVLDAALSQDEVATRVAVDGMRQFKSELGQVPAATLALLDSVETPQALRMQVQQYLEQIGKADTFVPLWCGRYQGVYSLEVKCQSVAGAHLLLDECLPLAWNWKTDLLMIFGTPTTSLLEALAQRGQQRITVVEHVAAFKQPTHHFAILAMPNLSKDLQALADFCHSRQGPVDQQVTRLHDSVWLQQYLKNLPLIQRSDDITSLKDAFKGQTLVFVAPGPSLDKNIHQLKQLSGRVVILAAVQAAKALSAAGVVADYMVLVDPKDFSYVLDGADLTGVKALFAGVTCHENFLKRFEKVIFCNVHNELDDWLHQTFGSNAVTGRGGSVAVTALNLALYLGASPIILVGQDLALTDGQVYSKQSVLGGVKVQIDAYESSFTYQNCSEDYLRTGREEGEDRRQDSVKALKLPGFWGGEVLTRPDFYLCHEDLVNMAKNVSHAMPEVQLINCTEGGAYIDGFDHFKLLEKDFSND